MVCAMKSLALLVVEPNELLIEGLRRIVARSPFRIAYHYKSVTELAEADVPDEDIAAVVMDSADQSVTSVADMENVRRIFPKAKIILMWDSVSSPEMMRAFEHIDGIILKSSGGAALVKALELIILGERIFPMAAWLQARAAQPDRPRVVDDDFALALEKLSGREIEVLKLLCNASPNKVIARELGISEATVKVHVKAILRKTRTRNRTEAALLMRSLEQPITGSG